MATHSKILNAQYFLILICLTCFLSSCATTDNKSAEKQRDSAVEMYRNGKNALKSGDYELAIEYFSKLRESYPFGEAAQQARLDTAYAHYKFEDFEDAIDEANLFIKTYPRHKNVDYAYYLRGLASYNPEPDSINKFFKQDPTSRGISQAKTAFEYFELLIKLYPNSAYIKDAIQRMINIRENIAQHELYVAQFYVNRGAYVAANNRAKYIIENFSQTTSVTKALVLLKETYQKLGLADLSDDVNKVINAN